MLKSIEKKRETKSPEVAVTVMFYDRKHVLGGNESFFVCESAARSLSHTEKFSAEEPMARSALVVLAASLNTRSPQAAATVITTMTEQRRCEAA